MTDRMHSIYSGLKAELVDGPFTIESLAAQLPPEIVYVEKRRPPSISPPNTSSDDHSEDSQSKPSQSSD